MHSAVVVVLGVLLGYCSPVSGQGAPCTVDEAGTRGVCQRLQQCPELLRDARIASDARTPSSQRQTIISRLRSLTSQCTAIRSRLLICCQNEVTRTTPRPRIVTQEPSITTLPTNCGTSTFTIRIIGGEKADVADFPWMASIQYTNDSGVLAHNCGGSLITQQHVLTAAHCLVPVGRFRPDKVILGELDFNSEIDCSINDPTFCSPPPITVDIESFLFHPQFENIPGLAFPNDIGIIKLARAVTFNTFVAPICLLSTPGGLNRPGVTDLSVGENATIAGWGRFFQDGEQVDFSPHLQFAKVPMQPRADCMESFDLRVPFAPGRICAGAGADGDTCRGDSGGPIMMPNRFGRRWFQTGISSFGLEQCGSLAAYTRIVDYIDWIRDTIREL